MPIRLLTFTTLFPNSEAPNHGVFVENRLRHLVASGAVESTVLAPVPFFPKWAAAAGRWGIHARVPRAERRHGLAVYHPRYPVLPKFGMSVAPFLLYRAMLPRVRRLIADGLAFDAIDAHYFYPDGIAAVWLAKALNRPVVVTARGTDVNLIPNYAIPRRLLQRSIPHADGLVAVSEALKRALVELGAPPSKVKVLRNGVDTVLFRPTDRKLTRCALGLKRTTLISAGHLIERKGHDRVISALAQLPGADLLIVGEGPERERLTALAHQLGVSDRVRFLGARPHPEMPKLYSAADVLVLASTREGWANVLLEAMACGTPVVASPAWGNPEVVRAPEAGVIAASNRPGDLAAAVRDVIANAPPRAATRAYAERFSWDETTAGQIALFQQVLGHAPSRGIRTPALAQSH
ncbi:MAG: glycosyltransferase family 4 protein [Acetobacteraceae bacterium]|nr:glycosyltransferase family 4 protein [Acetobacteraceae bacterium]MBV8521725.1 glycosyltransferase family 4 protein [Acetobacteraceae bacterium]MBV8590467.1 glycosyltransferase family 4 protein [Acetobacteraceae bacterium]